MKKDKTPSLDPDLDPIPTMGAATLTRRAFAGGDLDELLQGLIARLDGSANDAGLMLDASLVLQLAFKRSEGLALQQEALARSQLYRVCGAGGPPASPRLRLLALVAPGDLMVNTPLEFIVENSEVRLDLLYLLFDRPLPERVPDHDLLFLAVSEAVENAAVLRRIELLSSEWPRPVVNRAERIRELSRPRVAAMLKGLPGVTAAPTVLADRKRLDRIVSRPDELHSLLPGVRFPILARPMGSHAGASLEKLEDEGEVERYLAAQEAERFYLAPFIDYKSSDGLYRKYRIVFIERRPYLCHVAISSNWMIHYLNAGMDKSAEKRREEALTMENFDEVFARRHAAALAAVERTLDLDYVGIDCAESTDGRLFVFEADVAMIIHTMDPPDLYPYKLPQMQKVFNAFFDMLDHARQRYAGL